MIVYSLGIIVDMMYRAIRIVLYAAMFFLSFTWLIGKINAYQNRELEEFRRGIKDIDWKFHNRNIMTINTYIKAILRKDYNIKLDSKVAYYFHFDAETLTLGEYHGEGRMVIENFIIPDDIKARIDFYKKEYGK